MKVISAKNKSFDKLLDNLLSKRKNKLRSDYISVKNIIKDVTVNGTKVRFQKVKDLPPKDLRKLVDLGKKEIGDGIIIVFANKYLYEIDVIQLAKIIDKEGKRNR